MILLTGATGYIASHTWLALHSAGLRVVGLDNFANSSPEVLERLAALGVDARAFVRADVTDRAALDEVFRRWPIEAAIHFAALKSVGESVARPLEYHRVNVGGLVALLGAMQAAACRTFVFSSSATVYGEPERLPLAEDARLAATSPYGATKLIGEDVLRDLGRSEAGWRVGVLRYFNPVGAHPSGTIGEDPRGTPNNLMPYIAQVAVRRRPRLQVFGADYPTPDGTGVRDYLHVDDLAEGHVAALRHLSSGAPSFTVNLGTGRGVSVLELVRAFERSSGQPVPFEIVGRRPGDVAACYADPARACSLLGWRATRDLDAMCADTWRWQQANPDGFAAR
ncbi:MAG TPA: UDP-glucose 4-epimerase GalE [Caldimonas sp.]|nr:UDP-glucose 4-epimerase GalE [Caldimonas sp.]